MTPIIALCGCLYFSISCLTSFGNKDEILAMGQVSSIEQGIEYAKSASSQI